VNGEPDIAQEPREEESPREEIARLEARIEALADAVERCRKLGVFAKVLAAAGALWLALELVGAVRFGAPATFAAITTVLGGFILGGSNRSTMLQTQAALGAAEDRRKALIGAIELRLVNADVETGATPGHWLH
jgi:hypothetical protein